MRLKQHVIAVLVAAAVTPAAAGIFDEDARKEVAQLRAEIDKRITDIDARMGRLDDSVKNLGIIQLLNQIEQLNGEIAKLRGQIEVLANQNDQLAKRQKDFYLDIDTRLRKLEGLPPEGGAAPVSPAAAPPTTAAPASGPTPPATTASPPTATTQKPLTPQQAAALKKKEEEAYDVGSNAFKRNDFAAAIRAFQIYMTDYPQGSLVSNAQYWIGISHRNLKDYVAARAAQDGLIKNFADSPKVPDAMLEIANVQIETNDLGSARNTLEDIIARFPMSDAAAKARMRLAALRR